MHVRRRGQGASIYRREGEGEVKDIESKKNPVMRGADQLGVVWYRQPMETHRKYKIPARQSRIREDSCEQY